jgi:hypothetical protein
LKAESKLTEMSKLRPIAAPFSRRWREFRIQYLPFVAFGLSVLAAAVFWREFALPRQVSPARTPDQASCLQLNCDDPSIATITPVSFTTTTVSNPPPVLSD